MANALTDFIRKRDFLVCMDSDGCVMDTVRIKHCSVFCPELIRVFGLEAHTDFITTAWEEINLNSITRGISRFESAVLIFDRLKTVASMFPAVKISPRGFPPRRNFPPQACSRKFCAAAAWPCASCRSGITPATAAFRPWNLPLSRSPAWNTACISCTPWPMWRWFPPPMKALSPASGHVTALPPMPM